MTSSSATAQLTIEVVGTRAPQGSKSFKGFRGGKPILVESCAGVQAWRRAVEAAAREAMQRMPFPMVLGPNSAVIDFFLPRPVSAPRTRTRPDRRPDLDKLVRSTLDALVTAATIEDDARIVEIVARKHYAESRAGARILVQPASADPNLADQRRRAG